MNVSAKGVELIASFEGFRAEPYNDPADHATIGFGHLIHRGPVTDADRKQWGTLTRQQGLDLLAEDLVRYCEAVSKHVRVPLNQNQFDALTSFTFNLGPGALAQSTLCRRLNDGNYDAVPSELPKFNKAGGRVQAGLTRRRKAEAALFTRPVDAPDANGHDDHDTADEETGMFGITDPKNGCKALCDASGAVYAFAPDGSPGGHYLGGLNNHPEWHAGAGQANGPAVAIQPWDDGNLTLSGYIIITRDKAGHFHNYNFPSNGSLAH